MMEYFTYKKIKKHQAEAQHRAETKVQTPLLDEADEHFLERMISAEGTPPPLPDRPNWQTTEAGDSTGNKSQVVLHDGREAPADGHHHHKGKGKGKEKENGKTGTKAKGIEFLQRTFTKKGRGAAANEKVVSPHEGSKEEDDINKILDDLNLAAVNNRAFSLSKESQQLVQQFTVILKDLVNGVPTAYDDLTHLLDGQNKTLEKSYDSLPSFLQKLITQLPTKLTSTLAPELLAVATEAQAFSTSDAAAGAAAGGAAGLAGAAKNFMRISSLKDLVTKPGAVVTMLKTIMNALKLRWPAFMGTNVLLSLGLFVLLFVFWYCHKRGKEVRLLREKGGKVVDSNGRIIELPDDPMLEAGPSHRSGERRHEHGERSSDRREHRPDREAGVRRERSHRSDRRERDDGDRDNRSDRGERREHQEHRHSDHLHGSTTSTPSRSHTERRSPRRSAERRGSEDYATSGRRDEERHDRR